MEFDKKMPIENIEADQTQGRFFKEKLSEELNPKNRLYQLRSLIGKS